MNGILNILKPSGMTSFDVVGYLRSLTKTKKIGHTGTLDPAATGVLPICIGSATKAIEFLTEKDKLYRAELTLGITTDTQDSTGKVLRECKADVTEKQIFDAFNKFVGKYDQVPPMYSAVKIQGKKLYELARNGITVERKPRQIEIYSLEIINIVFSDNITILFDVSCSKGTYIRTLCEDIGNVLGCGGIMSYLVRLKSGAFEINNSVSLEEVSLLHENGRLDEKLLGADYAFLDYKKLKLNERDIKKLINGLCVKIDALGLLGNETVRVYDENNEFVSIAECIEDSGNVIKSRKLFVI